MVTVINDLKNTVVRFYICGSYAQRMAHGCSINL
jgi:hypothetical protein